MEKEDVMRINDAKRRSFNNGWKAAVKKACEWLTDRVAHDSIDYPMATEHLIDDFRKALED